MPSSSAVRVYEIRNVAKETKLLWLSAWFSEAGDHVAEEGGEAGLGPAGHALDTT